MTCWTDACWNECVGYGVYTTECRNISTIITIICGVIGVILLLWVIREGRFIGCSDDVK